jgi:small subunit ribosomal protein S1
MNEQLKKFKRGDVVLGKVIKIEPSKALIKIEGCEPVYIIKEVASTQEIESIEEVLQLDKIYEFSIAIDYSARYYKYDEYYLSIADLEYLRWDERLEQLAAENVTVYSKVIQAFDYGVLVKVENQDFIISNIHLKTEIPNQKLVGTTLPLKVITVEKKHDNYNYMTIFVSHRWALLENLTNQKLYSYGDIVVGKIVKLTENYALADIGLEKFAYIALRDVSLWAKSCEEFLHLDLTREFIISEIYHNQGKTLGLSIRYLEEKIGLIRISQMKQENVIFYPEAIKETGRGNGYIVRVEKQRAFLPASDIEFNPIDNKALTTIPLEFFSSNRYPHRLYVSHRQVLAKSKLKQLKVGNLLIGKIVAFKEYGLFIRTDNLAVLLHISEVSQITVTSKDLNNIFKIDDEIKAIVIWMDIYRGRVSVSTKELEHEPGDMLKNPQLVYENAEAMAIRYRQLVLDNLNKLD